MMPRKYTLQEPEDNKQAVNELNELANTLYDKGSFYERIGGHTWGYVGCAYLDCAHTLWRVADRLREQHAGSTT